MLLIVEDDSNLLSGLRDILEDEGFSVLSACDGREALRLLRTSLIVPQVIISDVGMPNMDGYALLDEVRRVREWVEIPFIFLSALTDERQIRRGMAAGGDDYLTKPFKPDTLIAAIRAKLRRQAQISQAQNAAIKRVKQDLLTLFNHEFRTPLTPVVAYADLLSRDLGHVPEEKLRQYVQGILQGAERMWRLIENLLLLVDLETGMARYEYEARRARIDFVEDLLRAAADPIRYLADEKEITLVNDIDEQSTPAFFADPVYLAGALSRLIENAVKFTDVPNRTVTMRVLADAGSILFIVEDEGRGIAPGQLQNIFEMFYQIDRRQYEDQGVGAGLAIVRGIMNLHGGRVIVESTAGKGSRFTLALPREG